MKIILLFEIVLGLFNWDSDYCKKINSRYSLIEVTEDYKLFMKEEDEHVSSIRLFSNGSFTYNYQSAHFINFFSSGSWVIGRKDSLLLLTSNKDEFYVELLKETENNMNLSSYSYRNITFQFIIKPNELVRINDSVQNPLMPGFRIDSIFDDYFSSDSLILADMRMEKGEDQELLIFPLYEGMVSYCKDSLVMVSHIDYASLYVVDSVTVSKGQYVDKDSVVGINKNQKDYMMVKISHLNSEDFDNRKFLTKKF